MIVTIANTVLSYLTLASHILFVVAVLIFILVPKTRNPILDFIGKHGLLLAFLASLLASASSLFYSEIAGFEPCKLCWFQRIFMYPQVILLGMALWKKDYKIADYGLVLAAVGTLFALYHTYIYYGGVSVFPCQAFGLGASCTRRFVFELGYITIPLMSLTGFISVVGFLGLQRRYNKINGL